MFVNAPAKKPDDLCYQEGCERRAVYEAPRRNDPTSVLRWCAPYHQPGPHEINGSGQAIAREEDAQKKARDGLRLAAELVVEAAQPRKDKKGRKLEECVCNACLVVRSRLEPALAFFKKEEP